MRRVREDGERIRAEFELYQDAIQAKRSLLLGSPGAISTPSGSGPTTDDESTFDHFKPKDSPQSVPAVPAVASDRMLVRQVWVSDFNGVDAVIPWADVVVLFGKNDAGKTNVLEGITAEWSDQRPRRRHWTEAPPYRLDPLYGIQSLHDVEVLIELEYLELSQAEDRSVLAHLLQIRHAPPLFPYYDPKVDAELDANQHDAHDQTGSASRFPPAQLRWGADIETPFSIGCLDELNAEWGQNDLGSPDDCLHALREQALAAAPTSDESWPRIEAAFRTLLESCLSSRWLRAASNGVAWMTPRLDEITDEVRTASALIAAHGALVPVVGPFADSVATGALTDLAFSVPFRSGAALMQSLARQHDNGHPRRDIGGNADLRPCPAQTPTSD